MIKEKRNQGHPGNKHGGRPIANIDWEYVSSLLVAGCSGAGIAPIIGINENTLYDRCKKDKNISFSEYSRQMQSKGDDLLRKVQFDKAMSGDNTLLVWLGKVRLKQIDASQLAAAEAGKVNYNIVADAKGIAVGIPSERLSTPDNKSTE